MNQKKLGSFCALGQGMCFGVIPTLIQSATQGEDIPNSMGVLFRFLVASLVLLPVAIMREHRRPGLTPRKLFRIFLSSLFMSVTSILLYTAYNYIPTSMGITLHYTYPIFTLLLSILLFHTRPNRQTLFSIALSFCGVVLLCDVGSLAAGAWRGIILAACSAVTFTVYLLWTQQIKDDELDSIVQVALTSLFNFLVMLAYNTAAHKLMLRMSPRALTLFVISGIIAIFALLALTLAVEYAGAVLTSILGTLEPIVCTVGGALVLRERITPRTVCGILLVVAAVIVATLAGQKNEEPAPAAKGQ